MTAVRLPPPPAENVHDVLPEDATSWSPLDLFTNRFAVAVGVAIALGVLVRVYHVLTSDFPLNDGGLFYVMARDLQDAGYALPSTTTYNGGDIPFAYPPFGFYFAALADHLTPLSLLDVFRFGPLLATCLTVPAFYLLARTILTSRVAVVAAVFAFAMIPRSYVWLLMGGGMTRSFGFLFALLALYHVCVMLKEGRRSSIVWAAVFCALTVLSHLETAWFLASSIAVFVLVWGPSRDHLRSGAMIAAGTLVLTAPWWGVVVARHGLDPFLAASETGGTVLSGGHATTVAYTNLLRVVSTSEPLFPLLGTLALLGMLASLATRRWLLPLWWAAVILLDIRSSATYSTAAVAMLAGVGAVEVLLPLLFQPRGPADEPRTDAPSPWRRMPAAGALPGLILAFLVVYSASSSFLRTGWAGGEVRILQGLTREDRNAVEWAAENTPPGSRFLIIPDGIWQTARLSEWFPALTSQTSVATVQGTEWLPHRAFHQAVEVHEQAFQCQFRTTDCLSELGDVFGAQFDYVFVPQIGGSPCCYTLVRSLHEDSGYELAYKNSRAVIFRRLPALDEPVHLLESTPR